MFAIQNEEYTEGTVDKITYHNKESGFCVFKIKPRDKNVITIVGYHNSLCPGVVVKAKGTWFNNKEHGLQFKAHTIEISPPNNLQGIEKYLASGLIKGIGKRYAKDLIDAFGEQVFDIIEKAPEKLTSIKGIGKGKAEQIRQSWNEQKVIRDIIIFLQEYGIGTSRAAKIYKIYGDKAVQIINANPYCLIKDIKNISFKTADEIAKKIGIDHDALQRIEAGLNFVLQDASLHGHCGLPKQIMLAQAASLLGLAPHILETSLETLIQTRRLFEVIKANEEFIFLGTYFKCEQDICNKIKILQSHPVSWKEIKQEDVIQMVEKKLSVSLHHQQKEAVKEAVNSKVMVITGGPGTGKTTIVRAILAIQKARGLRIKLAAPTGRAAKRLSESCKTEATTIHRLLEFAPGGVGFYYNEEKLLQTDMVIIDEASMIDVILMDQVLKALPETCSLVLVGDIDQLPSVGVGNVLKDIIESNTVQIMRLTEIFRQEKGSMIIANAHLINQGLVPQFPTVLTAEKSDFYFIKATRDDLYKKILYLLKQRIPEKFNLDPIHDVQILSPMQKGGSGAYALNIALQHALNSNATEVIESNGIKFSPGDKVMQISNNYDLEVFNGDIGFVKSIDSIEQEVTVTFENREVRYEFNALDQLSLAYAITIHKSQGSEFPVVIIPLLMQHFVMLKRNLLYTAVTRGKHLVIIVGEEEALTTALVENKAKVRYTMLRELLSTN